MKAQILLAALLIASPALARKANKGAVPVPAPRPIRITVELPERVDKETLDLLAETGRAVGRLLGPEAGTALSLGAESAGGRRKVWTAPRWSPDLPEAERTLALHGLRRLWGDDLKVDPDPRLPDDAPAPIKGSPVRPEARDQRAADFAASGEAQTSLAARFAGLPDQGVAFDNAAERVTDAVAAPPTANLPAFPARPEAAPQTAPAEKAPAAAPPAPAAARAPAVGEGSKDACAPLRGKGSKPNSSLEDVIAEESKCSGVSADVIKALIAAKGGHRRNPLVVTGPAADWVGVRGDLSDPRTSVRAGSLLLAKLYKFFKGDLNRALAAYEVGTTSVVRSGGIPNNKAVKELLAEFQRSYRQDGDKPVEPVTPPESPNLRRAEEEVRNVLSGPQLAPRVSFSATAPYRQMIQEAARIYGVDPALIEAVMLSESGGNPRDQSSAGAKGLMQLMPETARYMGVKNIWDPKQNINGGTRYLKEMLDRFHGNAVLAVAAYNAGPNRDSLAAGRVPTISETVKYTTRVMHRYSQLTGTEMVDFSNRLTAKGRRLYEREAARLQKLWGPTPEDVPVPTPAPTAR